MLYTKEYNTSNKTTTLTDRLIQLEKEIEISHVGTTMYSRITKLKESMSGVKE